MRFDLWGFGDSDKSSWRYEMDAYVSLIGLFLDELGILPGYPSSATIWGQSWRYCSLCGIRIV